MPIEIMITSPWDVFVYLSKEITVKFDTGTPEEYVEEINTRLGTVLKEKLNLLEVHVLEIKPNASHHILETVSLYAKDTKVVFAWPSVEQLGPPLLHRREDFNRNSAVDFPDFILFVQNYGKEVPCRTFESQYDLNGNMRVDFDDFLLFAKIYGWRLQI